MRAILLKERIKSASHLLGASMQFSQVKFCYACGGKLISKPIHGIERLVCSKCETITFLNSKPCVGALILDKDRILLTLRKSEPFKNHWDIPGGFLEYGEHPEQGLMRELREELGLEIKIETLFGIFMDKYGTQGVSTINIFYRCRALNEPQRISDEISDYKWFPLYDMPPNIAFESAREALTKLLKSLKSI